MTEEQKNTKKVRQIIIETDGESFSLRTDSVSPLELKEICREILQKLGG